jgi:serine/threonine-protein kinase RsbW
MAEPPNVLLDVVNRPENVLLVREMLSGVADAIELDGSELNDVLSAVTEACNNVVLHAYEGEEGPLRVEVDIRPRALEVTVRDHGVGIHPPTEPSEDTLGIGLPVIQALVHRVEFREVAGGGTEVWMDFATTATRAFLPSPSGGRTALAPALSTPSTDGATMAVTIAPVDLARGVLPRVLSTLAARAHFTTDRISDAQLMADALVTHAPSSLEADRLRVAVDVQPRNLELHVGPLESGRAQRLVGASKLDGLGEVIEKLADRHLVASSGSQETLTLTLSDRH